MNYITSCPACSTQFLLSDEHLKAHRGKVQCGHCEHVFNAKNRISPVDEDAAPLPPIDGAGDAFNSPDTAFAQDEADVKPDTALFPASSPAPATNATYNAPFTHSQTQTPQQSFATPITMDDLSASRGAEAAARPSRLSAILCILLLLVLACAQAIYYLRTAIAAHYPTAKPLLTAACLQLNCRIDLPKNLDLLLLDDSDMQQDEVREGVINLSSTLINHATYTQAYPNIELTLTNADDQAVIRSVITPAQYLKIGQKAEEGMTAQQELTIKLALSAGQEAVSGYRVQLIY